MATFTTRPVYYGTHGVVASGHYLSASAGVRMLTMGGNAIDAGVAAGFAVNVLKPQSNGIAGEAPILIYSARERRVHAINGQGWAPAAATIERYRSLGIDVIPGDGFLPMTAPAAFGAWVTALLRFGTLSLRDVLSPAIGLARGGFGVYPGLADSIATHAERFRTQWPSSAATYLHRGDVPRVGSLLRQTDWAETLEGAIEAEDAGKSGGREAGLRAALRYFYEGPVAEKIAAFNQSTEIVDASGRAHHGYLSADDMATYKTDVGEAVSYTYRGITVWKCPPWSQGPVFLQQLALLEGFDLQGLGHNSPDYVHTVVEAAKLAYADREQYYGDPEFVQTPLQRLLSKEYNEERRKLVDPARASMELRPGDAPAIAPLDVAGRPRVYRGDTTHVDAVDSAGNMFAATPSGGWFPTSPVVPGLGFPLGTRGQMFYLDERHANALAPHKRPRTTLTPSMATRDGDPWLAFGTPGGDQQDQWTLQFFLNYVDHGMDLQEALDVPTFHTRHFPSSFYPHDAIPGRVVLESRIPEDVRAALAARGHDVQVAGPWVNGQVTAVRFDGDVIAGAASPRGQTAYVEGY